MWPRFEIFPDFQKLQDKSFWSVFGESSSSYSLPRAKRSSQGLKVAANDGAAEACMPEKLPTKSTSAWEDNLAQHPSNPLKSEASKDCYFKWNHKSCFKSRRRHRSLRTWLAPLRRCSERGSESGTV